MKQITQMKLIYPHLSALSASSAVKTTVRQRTQDLTNIVFFFVSLVFFVGRCFNASYLRI